MEVARNSAPVRVLYVITKSNWGGAQRYVYDLAVAAKSRGSAVAVAAGGDGELLQRLRDADIQVFPIAGWGREVHLASEGSAFKELTRCMREFRPSVVHLNSSKAGLAALAARTCGVPRIIFTIHGWAWNEDRPVWQKAIIAAIYWFTLLLCHRAIAVSEAVRRQATWMPFVGRRIVVVHNGVHVPEFLPRDAARTHLSGSAREALWVGTIAELHPVKGLDVLVRAFRDVHATFPDTRLVLMGEGEERTALERLIETEDLRENVTLPGHVPSAANYLKAFDIFVLPSRSEGLAYVLLEAGTASLPVVATHVGGIPEVIRDRTTGLLVPYGDAAALANAIVELIQNEELRLNLAGTLHKTVARDFSLQKMVQETLALY